MYKNGLKFPVNFFYINDNEINTNLDTIKSRRNSLFSYSNNSIEDEFKNVILKSIITERGFELLPSMLNYFPDLIQSKIKFNITDYKSEYIKDSRKFNIVINHYRVDFDKVESSLSKIEQIATFDKSLFYQNLYLMLYKCFFQVITGLINYSDSPSSQLYFDITKDLKKFNDYIIELKNVRPSVIRNYDFKKNYVNTFFISFNTTKKDEAIFKAEELKKYTSNAFRKTFKNLLKITFNIKDNITAKHRNKIFKQLYIELMFPLTGKIYVQSPKTDFALTKEIKTFFADF